MKVVINRCYGGFGLSDKAKKRAVELGFKDLKEDEWWGLLDDKHRSDKHIIQAVEELKEEANGEHAELAIRNVPKGTDWYIDEYDGMETIHESHQSW